MIGRVMPKYHRIADGPFAGLYSDLAQAPNKAAFYALRFPGTPVLLMYNAASKLRELTEAEAYALGREWGCDLTVRGWVPDHDPEPVASGDA